MATYEAEAAHLTRAYRRAVGQALEYGIKVWVPCPTHGVDMKSLGDLREEIRAHESQQLFEQVVADLEAQADLYRFDLLMPRMR